MSESETAFMLEQGQVGMRRVGDQLGPLAGTVQKMPFSETQESFLVTVLKLSIFRRQN